MDWIKYAFSVVGCGCAAIWGNLDGLLLALLIFITADYITGVVKAIYKKQLSSEIGFKGLLRKVLIMIVVGIANVLDVYVLKNGPIFRSGACMFYIANEGISIMENVAELGVPFPKKLKERLLQVKKEERADGSSNSNEGNRRIINPEEY